MHGTEPCSKCGKEVRPAKGYLGGGVMCNECADKLAKEVTEESLRRKEEQ